MSYPEQEVFARITAGISRTPVWVLSETRLRSDTLGDTVRKAGGPIAAALKFSTRSEWYFNFARSELRPRQQLLAHQSCLDLILSLIDQSRSDFPLLEEELTLRRFAPLGSRHTLNRIKSAFDFIRMTQRGSANRLPASDEWGNLEAGEERREELYLLLVRYEDSLREAGLFDRPAMLQILAERFASQDFEARPQCLILDQPWIPSDLDETILELLARRFECHLLLSASESSVIGGLATRLELFASVHQLGPEKEGNGLQAAAAKISCDDYLGRECDLQSLPLDVWTTPSIFEECRLIVQSIEQSMKTSGIRPEHIHVLAPHLERYREDFELLASARKIPLHIPKPVSLRHTAVGRTLAAYLQWLAEPTVASLESLCSQPLYGPPPAVFPEKWLLRSGSSDLLPCSSDVAFAALRDFAERYGFSEAELVAALNEPEVEQRSLNALFSKQSSERQREKAVYGLFLYATEYAAQKQIASLPPGVSRIEAILRQFQGRRRRLSALREFVLPEESRRLHELVRGVRALRSLRKDALHEWQTRSVLAAWSGSSAKATTLGEECQLLRSMLESVGIQSVSAPAGSAVLLTELLDGRAISREYVFICGATADAFAGEGRLPHREDEARAGGEARQILAHVLRASRELVLSFPQRTASANVQPADALRFLATISPSQRNLSVLQPFPERLEEGDLARRARSERAILSRASSDWTAYDGDLRGLGASELLPDWIYSLSELEDAADCRHRIFFRRLLALPEPDLSFLNALRRDFGIVLHSALARFFTEFRDTPDILQQDFHSACRRLHQIATEEMEKSPRSWTRNPYERHWRNLLLNGLLDSGSHRARAGSLFGALRFQRDLVKSWPKYLEHRMLLQIPVEGAERTIPVKVAVDRIDEMKNGAESSYAVWDYKTGEIPSLRNQEQGKSLQIPIYAEAVRQNLSLQTLPARGGMIDLRRPNRTDAQLESMLDGVLLERLAVKRTPSLAFAPEQVSTHVSSAIERVRELDALIRSGDFRQQMDTEHCWNCFYLRLCFRDETSLERKSLRSAPSQQKKALPRPAIGSQYVEHVREGVDRPPSAEQELTCDVTKSLAVRAGAGSGKTFVLRTRFIRLLLVGAPLESIVAITFTEAAAAEIKHRIQQALQQAIASGSFSQEVLSFEQKERLLTAYRKFDRARIGTIHSFASSLIEFAPDLCGLPPFRHVVSGSERQSLIDSALTTVERGSPGETAAFDALLATGISANELRSRIIQFVKEPREFDRVLETMQREGAKGNILPFLRAEWERSVEQEGRLVLEFMRPWCGETADWLRSAGAAKVFDNGQLKAFQDLVSCSEKLAREIEGGALGGWFETYFALLAMTEAAAELALRKSSTRKNFRKLLLDFLEERKPRVSVLARPLEPDNLGFSEVVKLAEIVLQVRRQFRALKEARQSVDFADLIDGARRLLETERSGRAERRRQRIIAGLKRELRHFLIDEFQDTDREQWGLLRALCFEDFVAQTDSSRTLFLVGDNQQAIYGFRGGDVRVFEKAASELESIGGFRGTLQDNYRSHPDILDFCNRFFEQLFAVDFDEAGKPLVGEAIRLQPLRAVRKTAPSAAETSRVHVIFPDSETLEPEKKGKGAKKKSEAALVGDFIQSVLQSVHEKNGRYAALEGGDGGEQIAVLTRNRKELKSVRTALEERGISFRLGKNSGFFELEEIQVCRLLLGSCLCPDDAATLVGVLRSPFGGCSDAELLELARELEFDWTKFWSHQLSSPELRTIREVLKDLRRRSATEPLSSVLRSGFRASGLGQAYAESGFPAAEENVFCFIELMKEAEGRLSSGGSPAEIVSWMENLSDESAPPSGGTATQKVVLATIHSAKGLEFPMVILPFLRTQSSKESDFLFGEFDISGSGERTDVLLGIRTEDEKADFRRERTLIQLLISDASRAQRASEERRLFYVACTRAKEYLVFSGVGLNFEENIDVGQEHKRNTCFLSGFPSDWMSLLGPKSFHNLLPPFRVNSA